MALELESLCGAGHGERTPARTNQRNGFRDRPWRPAPAGSSLAIAPELRPIFEALVAARRAILERIRMLDAQLRAVARKSRVVRLFMTAPGIGPITALAVATAFDDAARFPRSSCAGAYLGLTPKRYESGEIS